MKMILAAVAFLVAVSTGVPALAQSGPFPAAGASVSADVTQAGVDQLLAPIALYPDDLLASVLAASTYPLEVVSLQRWLERNPNLSGEVLDQALAAQPWDASVKALAAFRPVVAMMNGELDWTQRLGNAFLASEADVMDAVQRLRRRAQEAGSLQDNDRERFVVEPDSIAIEPVQPDVVYVPVYDPRVVYGSWWWPAYPPYVWGVSYFGPWDFVVGGIAFGMGVHVGRSWHDHPRPDWRNRNLLLRRPGNDGAWRHDPIHRGGVPYSDPRTRDRFGAVDRGRVRERQDFRGFDVHTRPTPEARVQPANPAARASPGATRIPSRPAQSAPTGPSPLRPVPRESARQSSERGHQSLAPSRPAPSRPAPSRSAPSSQPREKR